MNQTSFLLTHPGKRSKSHPCHCKAERDLEAGWLEMGSERQRLPQVTELRWNPLSSSHPTPVLDWSACPEFCFHLPRRGSGRTVGRQCSLFPQLLPFSPPLPSTCCGLNPVQQAWGFLEHSKTQGQVVPQWRHQRSWPRVYCHEACTNASELHQLRKEARIYKPFTHKAKDQEFCSQPPRSLRMYCLRISQCHSKRRKGQEMFG